MIPTFGTAASVSAASLFKVALRCFSGMYPARKPTIVSTTAARTMDQIVTAEGRQGRAGKPPCTAPPWADSCPAAFNS